MGAGLERFFRVVASGVGAFWLAGAPGVLEFQPANEVKIFEKTGEKRAVIRFIRSLHEKEFYVFEKPNGTFFLRDGTMLFTAEKGRDYPEKQLLVLENSVSCQIPLMNLQLKTKELEIEMKERVIKGSKGIYLQWETIEVEGKEWEMHFEEKQVLLSGGVKGVVAEKDGH
ncbi:MAG: LPS export ABC transporter periplasmic protein LptC [bacterium]